VNDRNRQRRGHVVFEVARHRIFQANRLKVSCIPQSVTLARQPAADQRQIVFFRLDGRASASNIAWLTSWGTPGSHQAGARQVR
jgi:hypothetical protein